jgi:hypothetical protein
MSLLTELDAFYTEHRRCGDLDRRRRRPDCLASLILRARMARRVEEADDAADLELDARGPPSAPGGCT